MKNTNKTILEVRNLKTYFFTRHGIVKAVDGVSISVDEGETLGIVGESGSGKSIACLSILRLVPRPAGRIVSGNILLEGEDLLQKTESEMRQIRGRDISMMLQDPMTTLNPVFSIGSLLTEPIRLHQGLNKTAAWEKAEEMLRLVKIPSPELRMREYPHQLSGGMRQRVVGAMSLSCRPKIVIADEPTTALDPTIQSQFLHLIKEIQQASTLSMIMITHDLGIVARVCDRVTVMYAGRDIENAPVRDLFNNPKHPYTIALMKSLPRIDEKHEYLYSIEGQPPDPVHLPDGCRFAPRCNSVMEICKNQYPPRSKVSAEHDVNCWVSQ